MKYPKLPTTEALAAPTLCAEIADWMLGLGREASIGFDPATGEFNPTALAECAACDLGHSEWLDDDCHLLWDVAVDVAEELKVEARTW